MVMGKNAIKIKLKICWKLQKQGARLEWETVCKFVSFYGEWKSISVGFCEKKKEVFYAWCVGEEHVCEGRTGQFKELSIYKTKKSISD